MNEWKREGRRNFKTDQSARPPCFTSGGTRAGSCVAGQSWNGKLVLREVYSSVFLLLEHNTQYLLKGGKVEFDSWFQGMLAPRQKHHGEKVGWRRMLNSRQPGTEQRSSAREEQGGTRNSTQGRASMTHLHTSRSVCH